MRLRGPALPLWLFALLAFAAGCGGGRDATEKQLADLRAEITRLRASQAALTERLDTLEIGRGAFAKGAPAGAEGPGRAPDHDRPELDVVRLSPSEGDGDADNDAPRPVIRAVGSDGSVQVGKKDKTAGARTAPKKGAAATAPKKADADKP